MLIYNSIRGVVIGILLLMFAACGRNNSTTSGEAPAVQNEVAATDTLRTLPPIDTVVLTADIPMRRYFEFWDTLVRKYDSLLPYPVSEHLLVRANPWIIDSLENTDYYRMIERGQFVYDQSKLAVLKKGDTIYIPGQEEASQFLAEQQQITLDLNIPEFQLRILRGSDTLYTFPVRVGQNRRRYLAMSKRITDLRTTTGTGSIVYINKNPIYINPVDNKVYKETRRDDGVRTRLPRIPWIEPEFNGHRPGHFIHPTTNPVTLGKAYSNGCVGTREADAWRIYYYAPVGTRVVFRYDLDIPGPQGDTLHLRDIYGYSKKYKAAGFLDWPVLFK